MNIDPIIIGIAGGTGSGKSTLADNIKKEFAHNITMISHDCYYKAHPELPFEENIAGAKKVVEAAHPANVSVEAELGTIGSTDPADFEGGTAKIIYTNPYNKFPTTALSVSGFRVGIMFPLSCRTLAPRFIFCFIWKSLKIT